MTPSETKYRDTVNRLAIALLCFEGLFLITGGVSGLLALLTQSLGTVTAEVITELAGGLMYCVVFVVPVFLFYLISKNKPVAPMRLELSLPRETPLYIFMGIAVITGAAYINSYMVSFFNYGVFFDEVLWDQPVTTNYQLVLALLTTAVIPAFVEEFLFRGLILSNLRPFGNTTAVVGSALLFGMMHQNVGQLFYTTVAGLVIGYLYVKTESLWPCILLHFVNNFNSVLNSTLAERLPVERANLAIGLIQGAFCLLGVLSALHLMLSQKDHRRAVLAEGCFERQLAPHFDYAEEELSPRRRVRLFFSVPMIVFFAICVVQMGGLALVSLYY